jgi:GNAT superfamily N-acetyltransferase
MLVPVTTVEVGFADEKDADGVRLAVETLLVELSGDPTRTLTDFAATFATLLTRSVGGVVVARRVGSGELVGVLTYSTQAALRTGGEHVVIQELWVSSAGRGQGVGQRLVDFLRFQAEPGIRQIEVGLPGPGFPDLASTQAFYERCGFVPIGVRARWRAP